MAKPRIRIEVIEYSNKESAEAAAADLDKVMLAQGEDGQAVWVVVRAVYR